MTPVETAAILMTDLTGSTGLAARIGPAAAERLRREYFEVLREAIEVCGGREVKSLGDGLMVVFSSASSAVGCAVAMQQGIERRNRRSPEQLAMRVGLSIGDTIPEGGDYYGEAVVEARRLCDLAAAGQILARDLVAHMSRGTGGHVFRPIGALELKGLPGTAEAIEVAWELDEMALLHLPPPLQEMPPMGFVGRAAERERLRALFQDASERHRRLALIGGEPGIGKTRLCTHAAFEARAKGATVLYGRAEEQIALPYGPWVEALSHYVDHAPEHVLRSHVERYGGELARLLPALEHRLGDVPVPRETDPETERYLLWGAVAGLLREASDEVPIVLILDDLHWADRPSLLLLEHVNSQGHGMHVLILGTYRGSDLARGHPLADMLPALHRERGVERLILKGLAEPEIVEIMERAAGHELDEAAVGLSRELFRETDGNPFYTGELLRHLLESGGLDQGRDGRWIVRGSLSELGMPQSVREVVGRRVERLGADAQKALEVAAVIGIDFDADLLRRVTEEGEDQLLELLERAVAASVLVESAKVPGRFSFAHGLIHHTLYDDIGTTRRARLHNQVAGTLEELCGAHPGIRVAELANHWANATAPLHLPKAIGYARLAGERALTELAPDEALRWFQQALELGGEAAARADPEERCDVLIGLGDAQRQAGKPGFRKTLLEASRLAYELRDADRAGRAALANNRGSHSTHGPVDEERVQALEQALELDRFTNPGRCARLMSLHAMELTFDPDHERRRALAEEALALARGAGDPHTLAYVLRDHFRASWAPDTLELRRALLAELTENANKAGDPALLVRAALDEVHVNTESGELAHAEASLARARALADDLREPYLRWVSCYFGGALALLRGELVEAERSAGEALQIGRDAGYSDASMIHSALVTTVRAYQDRSEEIIEAVESGVAANSRIPAWQAALAWHCCWLGRDADASDILDRAASDGFAHVPHDPIRSLALAFYAEAAAHVEAKQAASFLYELMEPWADQIVWSGGGIGLGHVRIYLGLLAATLGREQRADEHFACACEFQERHGMSLFIARARLGWAEALARRGDRERARVEAGLALALARSHGYGAIERRAGGLVDTRSPVPE